MSRLEAIYGSEECDEEYNEFSQSIKGFNFNYPL